MATNNPPSFRLPISLPADVHPAVADALKNHDDAITDLQQAIPVLKISINAATGTTTSSSPNTSSQLAASDASETVIIPSPAANVIGFVNNQTGVTAYTTLPADYGAYIILDNASPIAVTLTGATTVTTPWFAIFINLGAGVATLTPASGLINSAANFALSANIATSVAYDGVNFWAWIDEPAASGVTQIIAGTNVTISPSGGTGAVTINASGGSGSYSLGGTLTLGNIDPEPGLGDGSITSVTGLDGNHTIQWVQGSTGVVTEQAIFTVNFTASRGHVTYPVIDFPLYQVTSLDVVPNVAGASIPSTATQYSLNLGSAILPAGPYIVNVSCP